MATKKLSVIERAEQRLAEEERQHELGADNRYDLHYWAAYLDGKDVKERYSLSDAKQFAEDMIDDTAGT
jgi:hypothetical protein